MALKKKILIGYGVAFVLMGWVVAWAVANLVSLGQASDAILRENYRSILAAENMVDALERQDSAILLLFMGDAAKGIAQFRENEAVFLQWLARAKDNITIQGEAELVQSLETDYATYRQQFSALTEVPGTHRLPVDVPLRTYQNVVYPLFAEVRAACIQLRNLNEATMYAASVRAGQVAKRAIWSTVLVAASALSMALIFSVLLAERLVRPLRRFMEASRQIASGDYAVQVPSETRDELGRLAGEFNQMAAQLGRYHALNIEQIIAEKNKGEAILASPKSTTCSERCSTYRVTGWRRRSSIVRPWTSTPRISRRGPTWRERPHTARSAPSISGQTKMELHLRIVYPRQGELLMVDDTLIVCLPAFWRL